MNEVLDRGDHLFKQLESIETVSEFLDGHPIFTTLGQYDSWRPAILLNDHTYDDQHHTVLHELGHHLHYLKIYEHPHEVADSREEWTEWWLDHKDDTPIENGMDAEYVADIFAYYHQGVLRDVPALYEELGGPDLSDDPLFEEAEVEIETLMDVPHVLQYEDER